MSVKQQIVSGFVPCVLLVVVTLLSSGAAGCSSHTGTNALIGTGVGAGIGAIAGGGEGAAIGAGVGALAGGVVGLYEDKREDEQRAADRDAEYRREREKDYQQYDDLADRDKAEYEQFKRWKASQGS